MLIIYGVLEEFHDSSYKPHFTLIKTWFECVILGPNPVVVEVFTERSLCLKYKISIYIMPKPHFKIGVLDAKIHQILSVNSLL